METGSPDSSSSVPRFLARESALSLPPAARWLLALSYLRKRKRNASAPLGNPSCPLTNKAWQSNRVDFDPPAPDTTACISFPHATADSAFVYCVRKHRARQSAYVRRPSRLKSNANLGPSGTLLRHLRPRHVINRDARSGACPSRGLERRDTVIIIASRV